jgi:hypothetical protein
LRLFRNSKRVFNTDGSYPLEDGFEGSEYEMLCLSHFLSLRNSFREQASSITSTKALRMNAIKREIDLSFLFSMQRAETHVLFSGYVYVMDSN